MCRRLTERSCDRSRRDRREPPAYGEVVMRGVRLLSLSVVLLTAACASAATPAPPASDAGTSRNGAAPQAAGAAALAPAVLNIPQTAERARMSFAGQNAQFATVWVAKDAGIFDRYGIDAEVTFLPS